MYFLTLACSLCSLVYQHTDEFDRIVDKLNLLTLDLNDYHSDYSPLFSALTSNKHLRQMIKDIHTMTDPQCSTTPILLNPMDVLRPADESLTRQFLSEISPQFETTFPMAILLLLAFCQIK